MVGDTAIVHRIEVSRVVAEAVHGIVIGGFLTPLGLMHAIGEYARPRESLVLLLARIRRLITGQR